jgi:small-conductance mechanosensitive channel
VKLCWLVWAAALVLLLFVAWGASHTLILGFLRILNHPIPIGNIHFRLLGLLYASLILLVTHVAVRIWRRILKRRMLVNSGMDPGLQESIAAISGYTLWGLAILAALNAVGVASTSIAVAVGALGIGLGFGLQNIFNNFMSGIILLFERPIQVGDVIEINGIWGKVAKINFRSTVVQSFDNASLVIPNSDFISNQLINWSFKDTRLRRNISIGVGYGSDVNLVRDTLLAIAADNPKILKYPAPDVLFEDFGDSALLFKLRVWSTTDQCLAAETEIRFEIDRLFRELGIEIPFPQRDIHIRSLPGDLTNRGNDPREAAEPPERD